MNQATFCVKVLAKPEQRFTETGSVAEFIGDVFEVNTKEPTSFQLKIKAWGKAAESVMLLVLEGSVLVVSGSLDINQVEKNGVKTTVPSMTLRSFGSVGSDWLALNQVVIVGRMGSDPDIRYFESGAVKGQVNLAVNRRRKDSSPDWFSLELWGKDAEVAANYTRKGSLVGISGSLKFDRWNDRESGLERVKPVIKVDQLTLLGSKTDGQPQAENKTPATAGSKRTYSAATNWDDEWLITGALS